jgi:hypothetical protein
METVEDLKVEVGELKAAMDELERENEFFYMSLHEIIGRLLDVALPIRRVSSLVSYVVAESNTGFQRQTSTRDGREQLIYGLIRPLLAAKDESVKRDIAEERDRDRLEREAAAQAPDELEVDYSGCAAIGVAGFHSDSYGQAGDHCNWCGALSPVTD